MKPNIACKIIDVSNLSPIQKKILMLYAIIKTNEINFEKPSECFNLYIFIY